MLDDLKPCPFCGSEAVYGIIDAPESQDDGGNFIQCTNACCAMSSALIFACGDDPKPILRDQWNKRVEIETISAENARLIDALEEVNMMACYASEEDVNSREKMLLGIGETARAALRARSGGESNG